MTEKVCVIYQITNMINSKIYIGKHWTKNVNDSYYGSGIVIKQAIKLYGKNNFKKEILEIVDNNDDAIILEKYYIFLSNSQDSRIGYNLSCGGDGFQCGKNHPKPFLNKKFTPEHIEKITAHTKGRKHSDEAKQKMSFDRKGEKNHNFGKKHSGETKQKMREKNKELNNDPVRSKARSEKIRNANTGKKMSDEAKQKMKENHKDYSGENHPLFGKKHNEESKKKMSAARKEYLKLHPMKNRKCCDQAKENMKNAKILRSNKILLFKMILMLYSSNYEYSEILEFLNKKLIKRYINSLRRKNTNVEII